MKLALNEEFRQGMRMKKEVQRIVMKNGGVYSMLPADAGAIAQCCANAPGDYLEIGSLFGGSAIIAALFSTGHVYGIDPFGYKPNQTQSAATPSAGVVMDNAYEFGTQNKITMFTQKHPPLPPQLENHEFSVAFIDGDHTLQGTRRDWENLKDRVTHYMLFHDVVGTSFGAKEVFMQAAQHPDWERIYYAGKMGVLERVTWS